MISRLTRTILRRLVQPHFFSFQKCPNIPKALFFTSSYPLTKGSTDNKMEDFDLKLKEACEKGESAVIELMNLLKRRVAEIGQAYKESIIKQIELIDVATKAGTPSVAWDELPKFRTQTADLNRQFNEFVATINILGQLSHNNTLKYITQEENKFKLIAQHHLELDKIVIKQIAEIKVLEDKLLSKNQESIEQAR